MRFLHRVTKYRVTVNRKLTLFSTSSYDLSLSFLKKKSGNNVEDKVESCDSETSLKLHKYEL